MVTHLQSQTVALGDRHSQMLVDFSLTPETVWCIECSSGDVAFQPLSRTRESPYLLEGVSSLFCSGACCMDFSHTASNSMALSGLSESVKGWGFIFRKLSLHRFVSSDKLG